MIVESPPTKTPKAVSGTTGIEARRERQRQEARRSILDATYALLSESEAGYVSIRSLAEKSGYSAPTVYYHFGDKDGLLAALLEDGMQLLIAELDRAHEERDALGRLRSTLLGLIRWVMAHPTYSALWGTVMRQPGVEMPPSHDVVRERLDAPLCELIDAGRMNGFDKTRAEQILWALVHGLITIQTSEPDHPWAPDLVEDAVDSLLRGMTTVPVAAAGGAGR